MKTYRGGCLCGHIRYKTAADPTFPHLCSCKMCQKWSGAITVAWVEFPLQHFAWDGVGGEPALYHSSNGTQRGFCKECGGTICALDDGCNKICITIASLDQPELIVPGKQHSYQQQAPSWWRPVIGNDSQ